MTDTLTITKTVQGRVTVLRLAGIINAQNENALLEAARAAHEDGAHFMLIDLTEVKMVMSAGLRALQNIYRLYTPPDEPEEWEANHPGEVYKSPHFKLAGASSQVHYVLSLSGFLHHIPMYPGVQEALESFGT